MDSKKLVELITETLAARKGKDIDTIEVDNVTLITDYFIICTGTSNTHIRALANEVDFELEKVGVHPLRKEGYDTAEWILIDYGSVVLNIFNEEQREYYSLEKLWSDGIITRRPDDISGGL